MQIRITKGIADDEIEARRADGTTVSARVPHKGPVPHDAVHYFVESELAVADGFWGMIAAGRHPEEIQEIAKAAGHASAGRAQQPDAAIVGILQAERAVECFEADLWGGGADAETFRQLVQAGCEQSLVPELELSDDEIRRIRGRLADFRDRWAAVPVGGSCAFEWLEASQA